MATRYAFGLIYDRWKLSDSDRNRDAFTDSYGVYCVYDRQDIAEEMGVTLPTVRKAIKAFDRPQDSKGSAVLVLVRLGGIM